MVTGVGMETLSRNGISTVDGSKILDLLTTTEGKPVKPGVLVTNLSYSAFTIGSLLCTAIAIKLSGYKWLIRSIYTAPLGQN